MAAVLSRAPLPRRADDAVGGGNPQIPGFLWVRCGSSELCRQQKNKQQATVLDSQIFEHNSHERQSCSDTTCHNPRRVTCYQQRQAVSTSSQSSKSSKEKSEKATMRGTIVPLFLTALVVVVVAATSVLANTDTSCCRYHQRRSNHPCLFQPLRRLPSTRHSIRTRYKDERRHDNSELLEIETTASPEPYDPVTDWAPPSPDVVKQTIDERITPLRRLTSPVFFSTTKTGQRHRGLGHVPSARPLLFVGNHQLGGLDIWLIVPELIQERHIFVRGLGHPVIFQNRAGSRHLRGGPTFLPDSGKQGTFGLYQKFGAVLTTPKNLHRLLQTKQAVLHFPGGAREAYHNKNEQHQLFWPPQDFVRTAAKFNATIVPFSAIGAADSVYVLADPETLLNLPFLGKNVVAKSFLTVQEAARYNERRQEQYIRPPPLVWPKLLPARHYFMFGKAFDTTDLDPNDRNACQRLYQDIQAEMMHGFEDLIRGREKDPFKDSFKRFVYEQVTGKQAPTFSVDELNAQ